MIDTCAIPFVIELQPWLRLHHQWLQPSRMHPNCNAPDNDWSSSCPSLHLVLLQQTRVQIHWNPLEGTGLPNWIRGLHTKHWGNKKNTQKTSNSFALYFLFISFSFFPSFHSFKMDYDSALIQALAQWWRTFSTSLNQPHENWRSLELIYAIDNQASVYSTTDFLRQYQLKVWNELIVRITLSLTQRVHLNYIDRKWTSFQKESSRLLICKAKNEVRMTRIKHTKLPAVCIRSCILHPTKWKTRHVAANVCSFSLLLAVVITTWFSSRYSNGKTQIVVTPFLIRPVWNSPVSCRVVLIQFRRSRNHVVSDSSIF